jgi:hypothetical protein
MSEQQSQQIQATQAETSTAGEPPKWGELPLPGRIAELEARLAEWVQLPEAARGDPAMREGRSAFDRSEPRAWRGGLTGDDVFCLAVRALAGSSEDAAISDAAERLRTMNPIQPDLSARHLEGAASRWRPPRARGPRPHLVR